MKNKSILNLNEGERIVWTYNHWISNRSCIKKTKQGTVVRYVKSLKKHIITNQMVIVQFDGNTKPSKVSEVQLSKL